MLFPLFRESIDGCVRREAEVAGEGEFEAHSKAIPAVGANHGRTAASRRRDAPREPGHLLCRHIRETRKVTAAREVFAYRAKHNDANPRIGIQGIEYDAELLRLLHRDDVDWRPVPDDVGAGIRFHQLDVRAVEPNKENLRG